jgi:hypothetical protein
MDAERIVLVLRRAPAFPDPLEERTPGALVPSTINGCGDILLSSKLALHQRNAEV